MPYDISQYFKIISLKNRLNFVPFPKQKPAQLSTVAYKASKEIDSIMSDTLIYKPWQFRGHIPVSINLKTTYDEIFIIAKAESFIRPNFSTTSQTVYIPTLFSKVNGISTNRNEYWSRINELLSLYNVHFISRFPFTKEKNSNIHYHYVQALDENAQLEPKKMIDSNWWEYKKLQKGLQLALAKMISQFILESHLHKLSSEDDMKFKQYLLNQLISLPDFVIEMIQLFDYTKDVPKMILFNNGKSGELSRSDAVLLLFLKRIGFDVIMFNTAGQNDIELYVEEDFIDIHFLEKISLNEQFKEQSVVKKFFKNIFK